MFAVSYKLIIVYMLWHVTHYYLISFVKGLFPQVSESQRGYTSLHEYVITIPRIWPVPKKYLALNQVWIKAPNQEPTLELHSRAAPSVEAHHRVSGPTTGRNSGGRQIIKKTLYKIEIASN